MQVSVESSSNIGRKLTISIPSDKIESAVLVRINELSKKVKVDGFRPGKVPAKVVAQKFGAGIREEVTHSLLQASLIEVLEEKKLQPAGTPKIEPGEIKSGHDFEFTATFDVFPDIAIVELDGVDVEQATASVAQTDIDSTIDKLLEQRKEWHSVEREARNGDKVVIDFDGYKDGKAFDGGKAEGFDLELGSGSMIPGFEAEVEGLKLGEEKEFNITFPKEYGHKDLAGQEVTFKIKLHKVSESAKPELNEEFVKQFDLKESGVEAFLEDVKKNMERELDKALTNMNKEKVFEAFLVKNPCDVPQALIDNEIQGLKKDMLQRVFGNQKVDLSKLPQLPDSMFVEQAKRRVHLGLLFSEYVKLHDLKPDQERVDAMLETLALSYQDPEELKSWYRGSKDRMQNLESAVLEEMAVEKMLQAAKVIHVEKDYEAVMNPKPESEVKQEEVTSEE